MRGYAVRIHPQAERDIDKAKERAVRRGHENWPDLIDDAIEAACRRLSDFPEIAHRVKVDGVWSTTTRSWSLGETGYVLRYRVEHDKRRIVVLRFRHEAQRPLK